MSIFSRLGDIINANINALLDRAENPEKMIRGIIQEMEDTLVEVRSEAAKVIADERRLQRKLKELTNQHLDWDKKARLALEKNREDLAKSALIEKNKLVEVIEQHAEQLTYYKEDLAKFNEDIAHLEVRIGDARSRQKQLARRQKTAATQLNVREKTRSGRLAKMSGKIDQFEKKVDFMEGKVESYQLGKEKSLHEEITDLELEGKIKAELKALKEKVKSGVDSNG